MTRMLPSLRLLQLLLICGCQFVQPLPPLRRNIIKVRASGFLPFESDLLLPLGILRQLQAQDRASRLLTHQQLYYTRPARRKPKPKPKQQVRLERAQLHNADAGIQMYNLIDDDGELLLNLRVHSDSKGSASSSSSSHSITHADAMPKSSRLEDHNSPWRASTWRPTTNTPLGISNSSPRSLPLHQYLERTPQQQQRRMFAPRQDWPYNAPSYN